MKSTAKTLTFFTFLLIAFSAVSQEKARKVVLIGSSGKSISITSNASQSDLETSRAMLKAESSLLEKGKTSTKAKPRLKKILISRSGRSPISVPVR